MYMHNAYYLLTLLIQLFQQFECQRVVVGCPVATSFSSQLFSSLPGKFILNIDSEYLLCKSGNDGD